MRIVVGSFGSTRADIFLLGYSPGLASLRSLTAQKFTAAPGVTMSEFPRQTLRALPSGNTFILRLRRLAKASETNIFVQPVSTTAITVDPWRSHFDGTSSFSAQVETGNIFRSPFSGKVAWKQRDCFVDVGGLSE